MDTTELIVIAGSSSVLGVVLGAVINGVFGLFKGRADVAGIYSKIAADQAVANRDMRGAIEKLTDAVDLVIPVLNLLAERAAPHLTSAEVIDLARVREQLRGSSTAARQAI